MITYFLYSLCSYYDSNFCIMLILNNSTCPVWFGAHYIMVVTKWTSNRGRWLLCWSTS